MELKLITKSEKKKWENTWSNREEKKREDIVLKTDGERENNQ